jgi:uncharacterized membrane protein YphA (DoxX/SURF4 family)
MTDGPANRSRTIGIRILRLLLCATFLVVGVAKLSGSLETVAFFAAVGWGQWFRYFTGALDTLGAGLLLVPRWTCFGAMALVCTIGLASVLVLTRLHQNPLVPLILTSLSATLAWLTRPNRTDAGSSSSS